MTPLPSDGQQPGLKLRASIPASKAAPGMVMWSPENGADRTIREITSLPGGGWLIQYTAGGGRTWPPDRDINIRL